MGFLFVCNYFVYMIQYQQRSITMKRKSVIIFVVLLTICVSTFFCLCGCSSNGLLETDFKLEITEVQVRNNRVIVKVEFKNTSWHNGWIHTGGEPSRPSTMIQFYSTDDIENPDHAYTEHQVTHWIKCKQVINASHEFQLPKGTYTITAYADFACNDEANHFRFMQQITVEV